MAENQGSVSAATTMTALPSCPKDLLEVDLNRYGNFYLAALKGNWELAKSIIDEDRDALTARLNLLCMTVLHVAAYSGHSTFVEKLVQMMSPDQVAIQDKGGNTALHYAAICGIVNGAKALVRKNHGLTQMKALQTYIPLHSAVYPGATKGKEMASFLASVTEDPFVQIPSDKYHLLFELTNAGFHDITSYLLRKFSHPPDGPDLATTTGDKNRRNILSVLALRPMDFRSGTSLNFWKKWIYDLAPCKSPIYMEGGMEDPPDNSEDLKWEAQVRNWLKGQIWKVVTSIAHSTSKKLQDTKLRHKYAKELVTLVCERAKHMPTPVRIEFFRESEVLNLAASSGIVEIVNECLQHFPDMIWYPKNSTTMLHDAIKHRRESIFNLLSVRATECLLAPRVMEKALKPTKLTEETDNSKKRGSEATMMNLVAKLAPSPRLSSISGTALQMQRELQWFQEVEKLANTSTKEKKDFDGFTPRQLFTKEHEPLVEKAEKWMKDTSNSCMVVTTLVATVVFSAAFTVPGGINGEGFPIFLNDKAFTLFIISDALALFSSLTSVLMFLSILTARYAEEDFLKKLPLKLLIGLASLFFAISTMMVAFVTTLWIVLHDKFKWIFILVTVLASIPVTAFLSLQLPLFFQIYRSTFIGIFHPDQSFGDSMKVAWPAWKKLPNNV